MTEHQRKTAEQYFEAYPEESVLHITSDGQVFLNSGANDAKNHQATLTAVDSESKLVTIHKKQLGDLDEGSVQEEEKNDDGDHQNETVTPVMEVSKDASSESKKETSTAPAETASTSESKEGSEEQKTDGKNGKKGKGK